MSTERRCSFCLTPQSGCGILIGYSRNDVAICETCVGLAVETIVRQVAKSRRPLRAFPPDDDEVEKGETRAIERAAA